MHMHTVFSINFYMECKHIYNFKLFAQTIRVIHLCKLYLRNFSQQGDAKNWYFKNTWGNVPIPSAII